jgi:NTP pyrophosphatase (non-canonical NTP hydrolase)
MAKSIQELTDIITKFSEERNWSNDDPNQLITSILIELGELAESFQWKNKFEQFSEEQKEEVGYEFVDILFYLLRLADKAGIDIEKYFDSKLPKLAKKFPIGGDPQQAHQEYRKAGKNKHYD